MQIPCFRITTHPPSTITTSAISHRRITSHLRSVRLGLTGIITHLALLFTRHAKNITSDERPRTEPSTLVMTDHHRRFRMVLHPQNIYFSLDRQLRQRSLPRARQYTDLTST